MGTTEKKGGIKLPCYHPLIRVEDLGKWVSGVNGKYHPAKIFSQEKLNDLETLEKYMGANYKQTIIPCGKCIGCKLDYSREWANRGYLESLEYENNYFVTLTYNDENLKINDEIETSSGITYFNDGSWNGTLVPEDFTQFVKNLRQIMKRNYNQDGIRIMGCGEYGSEGKRPHYHLIIFNLKLPLEDLYNVRIINNEYYYQSHIIERAWTKGISNVSEANWNSIAYTARYITKKINGEISEDYYASQGQEKEFFRVSRMPGIGENYYRKNWKKIYENDEILVKNKAGIIKSKPPKYFDNLFKKEHPKEFKKLQLKREKRNKNANKVKDENTSLFRRNQLEVEERSKNEQTLKLRREFEKKGPT